MNEIRFEWDQNKNLENIRKHKVSFEEAKTVFFDENARLISDPDHSTDEDRFILMGLSEKLNIIVVVHVYRKNDEIIIIISAKKATEREIKHYFEVK